MEVIGIGAGGHCKVVLNSIATQKQFHVLGLIEQNNDRLDADYCGTKILGDEAKLPTLLQEQTSFCFLGVGAIGQNNSIRKLIFERIQTIGFSFVNVIDSSAVVASSVVYQDGLFTAPGVLCNTDTTLGKNVVLNTGSIIEHDCCIEDHAFIGPGAILCGEVKVGELAFVGAGARIKQGVQVGANAVVGMGATVLKDVPAGSVVTGIFK